MASRNDSFQDIFEPSDGKDDERAAPAPTGGSSTSTATNVTIDHQAFDDIFATGEGSAHQLPGQGSTDTDNPEENIAVTSSSSAVDLDNIFGGPSLSATATTPSELPGSDSRDGQRFQNKPIDGDAERVPDSGGSKSQGMESKRVDSAAAGGDKEFLDFLYKDEMHSKREQPGTESPAIEGDRGTSSGDARHAPGATSDPEVQPDAKPLADGPGFQPASGDNYNNSSNSEQVSPPGGYPRKQRPGELAPLPKNPGMALRELALKRSSAAGGSGTLSEVSGHPETVANGESTSGVSNESVTEAESAALANDVSYIRRLCTAAGGFLSPELRPAVWSLLLGLGRQPRDAGFETWRAERQDNPELVVIADTSPYKIDLRNDSLALARRLCERGEAGTTKGESDGCSKIVEEENEKQEAQGGEGGGGKEGGKKPEALAVDIEEVLTFYCTRRSEAYEPILCALVGPLFSMGLDPPAVSAMLHPLVGSLTLFLGRGLTLLVRDLAWTHAHRRLHDLCTYHDPELVQHLDRCFPGWEMPLPAASVSRAETSALDQEAAAMVDDLETSLAASLPKRRLSGKGTPPSRSEAAEEDDDGGVDQSRHAEGQGLVEPSLLVAASAGLGAAAPLASLLPLWDYLLVRHDKHFGFFLLLASLLRRRESLLDASGPQLRAILAEALSPADMATRLGAPLCLETDSDADTERGEEESDSPLLLWCSEAEALDLATPESFRHHLALIGEIAEAEHEAAVRARAQKEADGGTGDEVAAAAVEAEAGPGAVEPEAGPNKLAQQADGNNTLAGRGQGRPSLLRMRSLMKNAGDKIAADLKSLKLTRATASRELAPPPPTELSLPQLCLAVSAKEVVTQVAWRAWAQGEKDTDQSDGNTEIVDSTVDGKPRQEGEGRVALFRKRKPLSYFAVDCRPKEQVDAGRFPTAFHLDPSSMDNPEEVAEKIMSNFEPLRGRAHVCLVGSGDGHLRARGTWAQTLGGKEGVGGAAAVGSQRAARDEYTYVNTCALFFIKRGFPFVSVLEGGYAAAHELVMDETIDRGSEHGKLSEGARGSTGGMPGAIVDHNPSMCRLCVAKKDGNPAASVGGGMGGLLFPLSPPLWARIGAADSSVGRGGEEQPTPTDDDGASKKTPLFFPGSLSRNNGGDEGDHAKTPSKGGDDETSGGEAAAEGGEGHSGSSGFFNTAGVFRGMNVNMASVATMFKGGGAAETSPGVGPAASSEKGAGAGEQPTPTKPEVDSAFTANVAADLAAKWGVSFGRLASKGVSESSKGDPKAPSAAVGSSVGGSGTGSERGPWSSRRDSGFGSIFRKAQGLKAADVAAAFADLRDGPKTTFTSAGGALGAALQPQEGNNSYNAVQGGVSKDEGGGERGMVVVEEEKGGIFVIGDDGSEASETPDSDFEGFDGEHRPPSTGGARSAADKELALLEHRLSGQVKGATMVVDEFLKVPGAKVFTVTKHKVTYHEVDATPPASSENASTEPETEVESAAATAAKEASESARVGTHDGVGEDSEASTEGKGGDAKAAKTEGEEGSADAVAEAAASTAPNAPEPAAALKKLRVRAVTELERTVFITRERILVLACPDGPKSPGLVKSNRHLTELQKMTFMRRDPTLVTLHYFALTGPAADAEIVTGNPSAVGTGGGRGLALATKKNVYRFGPDDKETFIRIMRGALQRFQS